MDSDKVWATPFEVLLAARRFNCIIHLFHSECGSQQEAHYCFPPDTCARSSRRREDDLVAGPQDVNAGERGGQGYPIIFLKSQILHGQFWFQWYQTSPKLSHAKTLRCVLSDWLKQDDIRPISFRYLGATEREFQTICSAILADAHKTKSLSQSEEV